jgi:hypothetical protein
VTFYDIPGIVNSSLDLAASPGIKAGFQVPGIYSFNRDIFHVEECMWAYVTVTVNTPKTSMDYTGPSISTSKEKARPFPPEEIRPLPKPGHRKSQNVQKKGTTAIFTDTPVKNTLKKTTMHALLHLPNFTDRWIGILCLKTNYVGCTLPMHCVSFDSNFLFQLK